MKISSHNEIAKVYDEARPSYPDQLIDDIITKTNITLNDNLLELGAGTGKATSQFAKKGFSVHCIEPGQNLVNILKEKYIEYPNITVDVDTFENWKPNNVLNYSVIYSASAFHWIEPDVKYKKCHELLKEHGYLALFWFEENEESEVKTKINSMIKHYVPNFSYGCISGSEKMKIRKAELTSSGYFVDIETFEYPWESTVDTQMYIKIMNSVSHYATLDEKIKLMLDNEVENIINTHGGFVTSKMLFTMFIARKS